MERLTARRQPHGSTLIHCADENSRQQAGSFIEQIFAERFSARIDRLPPGLVCVRDGYGRVCAAAGYRSAASERLFLEQYLDAPVEEIIQMRYGECVKRSQIVEVGNLATNGGRAALALISGLIHDLLERGFTWVAFTGNDAVRNMFQRLHLFPFAICHADRASLGAAGSAWGTYYDHHPIVMAGRLGDGAAAITLPAGLR